MPVYTIRCWCCSAHVAPFPEADAGKMLPMALSAAGIPLTAYNQTNQVRGGGGVRTPQGCKPGQPLEAWRARVLVFFCWAPAFAVASLTCPRSLGPQVMGIKTTAATVAAAGVDTWWLDAG